MTQTTADIFDRQTGLRWSTRDLYRDYQKRSFPHAHCPWCGKGSAPWWVCDKHGSPDWISGIAQNVNDSQTLS